MFRATSEQWIQVELKVRDRIDFDTDVNFKLSAFLVELARKRET